MNIFDLIEPINLINQIKTDALSKQRNSLNVSITRKKPAYSFMASRMHSKPYDDSIIETAVTPQTRKNSNGPVNKSLASRTRIDIMVPDLNRLTTETERYKFVTTASRKVLDKIDPSMYFGIRVGPSFKPFEEQLIYDFDGNVIYKRVYDTSILLNPRMYVYDSKTPYMMLDKNNYRNVFVDTKNYVPILRDQLISYENAAYDDGVEEEVEQEELVPYIPNFDPREEEYNREATRKSEEYKKKVSDNLLQQMTDVVKGMSKKTDDQIHIDLMSKLHSVSEPTRRNCITPPFTPFLGTRSESTQTTQPSHPAIDPNDNDKEFKDFCDHMGIPKNTEGNYVLPTLVIDPNEHFGEFHIDDDDDEFQDVQSQDTYHTIDQEPELESKVYVEYLYDPTWLNEGSEYLSRTNVEKNPNDKRVLHYHSGNKNFSVDYSDIPQIDKETHEYIQRFNGYHGLLIFFKLLQQVNIYSKTAFEENYPGKEVMKEINETVEKCYQTPDPSDVIPHMNSLVKLYKQHLSGEIQGIIDLIMKL